MTLPTFSEAWYIADTSLSIFFVPKALMIDQKSSSIFLQPFLLCERNKDDVIFLVCLVWRNTNLEKIVKSDPSDLGCKFLHEELVIGFDFQAQVVKFVGCNLRAFLDLVRVFKQIHNPVHERDLPGACFLARKGLLEGHELPLAEDQGWILKEMCPKQVLVC